MIRKTLSIILSTIRKLGGNFSWIPITDSKSLPKKPEYDWVLVRYQLVPEGCEGVPCIAELRNGVWYEMGNEDGMPFEKSRSVKVTHWMPIPSTI